MLDQRGSTDDHDRPTDPATRPAMTSALLRAALAILVGSFAWIGPITGAGARPHTCDRAIETYRLAEPGSYSAFTRSSSGPAHLEVRGPSGESLAESPSATTSAAGFDLSTAMRFGVPAPPVFDVDSHVDLHVDSTAAPYDLVLVRFGDSDGWSDLDVIAPATVEPDAAQRCGPDGDAQLEIIRVDAVYSDVTARQVFVISSDDWMGGAAPDVSDASVVTPFAR